MIERVVSLIPSGTEIVCALGLRERLVGVSHECDFPADVSALPAVCEPKVDPRRPSGEIDREVRALVEQALSVYRVKSDVLRSLEPDLVVTQHQCEVCAVSLRDVEGACTALGLKTRICSLEPECLADIESDFGRVAQAAGVAERGRELARGFRARLDALADRSRSLDRPRVLLVEWLDPPMVAGGWMPELARIAGAEPLVVAEPRRFQTVTWSSVASADPDAIVVMPCGFGVERTLAELASGPAREALCASRAARQGRLFVADGNAYFNRPGPRIADSAELLMGLVHPVVSVARFPGAWARFTAGGFEPGGGEG
jgi:iron complex transport system substrate-binding protein